MGKRNRKIVESDDVLQVLSKPGIKNKKIYKKKEINCETVLN